MESHDQSDTKKRVKSIVSALVNSAVVCIDMIVVMLIFRFITADVQNDAFLDDMIDDRLLPILHTILFLPLFYNLLKVAAVDLGGLEQKFISGDPVIGVGARLSFIFHSVEFYAAYGLAALVYLLLPLEWTFTELKVSFTNGGAPVMNEWALKLMLVCALFVLFTLGFLGACGVWMRDHIEHPHKKRSKSDITRMELIGLVPLAAIGMMAAEFIQILTLVFRLIKLFFTPRTLIVIAVAVAAFIVFRYARAFYKRMKFYRTIASSCKSRGFDITPISKPILSVFTMTDGESFRVTANGKTYSCKLISAPTRRDPLAIYDNGTCAFIHAVRFLRVTWMHYVRCYTYAYDTDADAEKILVVNPVPAELLTGRDGRNVPIDNGFEVGGYRVYAGTAFVNALERDSVK